MSVNYRRWRGERLMMSDLRWLASSAGAVLARPDLWRTTARVVRTHLPNKWWAQRPFLPVPDQQWMDFRFETAYADAGGRPNQHELIEYLEWSRSWKYL